MLSQIRPGQTSPELGPFLLLMARATIMVIDVSPACRSSVTFYVQKKCLGPFALLCPCVPVLGQEGSRFLVPALPSLLGGIHGRECCFFKTKEEQNRQTEQRSRPTRLPGVPTRVGVFWWHVLKTCHCHQSLWIPAPSIPSLSPFQFLVCFAGLVSEHPHVRASPFQPKMPC